MAALRALPEPSTGNEEVRLRGYHQLDDNVPQIYHWNKDSTAAPDGGAVVAPSHLPEKGRWLLAWDGVTANVRTWGARLVPDVYSAKPEDDSLKAINNAILALRKYGDNDHSQSPGAAGEGHTMIGQLYFPGGAPPSGYVVSGEILVSAYMRVLGDGSPYSMIAFLPDAAASTAHPKWVIRYLYNTVVGNPNENFYTGISGISVSGLAAGNPGSCGIFFIGSNGSFMVDCTASASLQPFKVDAKGVSLDRLTAENGCRGPGLELEGNEITCGYVDIEHVNMSGGAINPDTKIMYPAVYIHDLDGFSINEIATESSPLSVHLRGAFGGTINNIHSNPNVGAYYKTAPYEACVARIDGQADAINLVTMSQGPTSGLPSVIDYSVGYDTGGVSRDVIYNPSFGRGSYFQKAFGYVANFTNVSAKELSGSGAGLTNTQSQPTVYQNAATYAAPDADRGTRQVFNGTGPQQVTLATPTPASFVNGWYFVASNAGSVPLVLHAPAGHTVDGQPSVALAPRTLAIVTSDGTNYATSQASSGGERLLNYYQAARDTASVEFTVPPGVHHLRLLSSGRTTHPSECFVLAAMNGDRTPGAYVNQYERVEGRTVSAEVETDKPGLAVGAANAQSAPYPATSEATISLEVTPTPAGNASRPFSASALAHSGVYAAATGQLGAVNGVSHWLGGTTAVSSFSVFPAEGSFVAGSALYLYGD